MQICENCGKPATMLRSTGRGDVPTCDSCKPGDWDGDAKPILGAPPDLGDKLALSMGEAAEVLGLGIDSFKEHVLPHLKVVQVGSRRLIPRDELAAWVANSKATALKDKRNG